MEDVSPERTEGNILPRFGAGWERSAGTDVKASFGAVSHDSSWEGALVRVGPTTTEVVGRLLAQDRSDVERIAALERRVAELEEAVRGDELELRQVSQQEGKREVRQYFREHDGEVIYPSDVAEALRLDYSLVSKIIRELEAEGRVERA